ncbi:MAG: hypothetical protein M3Y35_15300, partial [Actinomycetota bacterium]|nr:hypothetical protein [Actinomycetota bacterium]
MLAKPGDVGRGSAGHGKRTIIRPGQKAAAACLSVALLASVAACSSSGSKSNPPAKSTSGSTSTSAGAGANVTAAKANLDPYTTAPTTFPVTDPLPSKLPAGKKFVFLQCGTPVCAGIGMFVKQAVAGI